MISIEDHREDRLESKFSIRNKWVFLAVVAVIGFALDILTKHLAATNLPPGRPVNVLGDFFSLLLVYNKGAIFGFDPRRFIPWFPLTQFFRFFSVVAVVVLLVYYRGIHTSNWSMKWGLALIMPGALGNFWDRLVHPELGVVDFIKMGLSRDVYWPIYNLADAYVTVGVVIIVFSVIREEHARATGTTDAENGETEPENPGITSQ